MAWLLLLIACGSPRPSKRSPEEPARTDSGAPSTTALTWTLEPSVRRPDDVWFARAVDLDLSAPATVDVHLESGSDAIDWSFEVEPGPTTLPLVGLLPDALFEGTLTATDGVTTLEVPLDIATEGLPEDYPLLEPLVHEPSQMSPGWTFMPFDGIAWGRYFAALDRQLRPRWLWIPPNPVTEGRVQDGIVWWIGGGAIQGHTLLGEPVAKYRHWGDGDAGTTLVEGVRSFHHEAYPLVDGFLTLSTTLREVESFPTRDLSSARPATLLSSTVVDLDLDGQVRRQVDLADVLDTSRVSWSSFEQVEREEGEVLDWSHANAVVPTPDGAWLVSLRHQDALVKLDPTGDVHWILGTPEGWRTPWSELLLEPEGEIEWPFHPHAPELLDDGGILLFDNHNYGTTPYSPPVGMPPRQRSRLVIYDIDETRGTVSQRWSLEELTDSEVFAFALGDADALPNGNILGVWGWVQSEQGVAYEDMGRGIRGARIVEVDPSDDTLVLDLRMTSADYDTHRVGWSAYRAQRLESLHPALTQWSEPAP